MLQTSCATSGLKLKGPHRVSLPRDPQTLEMPFPPGVNAARYAQMRPWLRPQQTDASCSAASLALIINTLRAERGFAPVDEVAVAATDSSGNWTARVQQGADGLNLDSLRLYALKALTSLQGPGAQASVVDVLHMPEASMGKDAIHVAERQVAYVLARSFAPGSEAFVVINALQSKLFRGGDSVGHFVVAAAYDEQRERILVLDVDSIEGLEPYWVSMRVLVAAMQASDEETGETRGLLWIHS